MSYVNIRRVIDGDNDRWFVKPDARGQLLIPSELMRFWAHSSKMVCYRDPDHDRLIVVYPQQINYSPRVREYAIKASQDVTVHDQKYEDLIDQFAHSAEIKSHSDGRIKLRAGFQKDAFRLGPDEELPKEFVLEVDRNLANYGILTIWPRDRWEAHQNEITLHSQENISRPENSPL